VAPALQWLLAHSVRRWAGPAAADALLAAFSLAYNALWLLPAYAVSLVVNGMWWVAGQQERGEVFHSTESSCVGGGAMSPAGLLSIAICLIVRQHAPDSAYHTESKKRAFTPECVGRARHRLVDLVQVQ